MAPRPDVEGTGTYPDVSTDGPHTEEDGGIQLAAKGGCQAVKARFHAYPFMVSLYGLVCLFVCKPWYLFELSVLIVLFL